MPNIKAAEKWTRQTHKRTKRNLDTKSRLKTVFKKSVAEGDAAAGASVESQFDKAASKGIIHPNKAARKKSRLAKALRRAAGGTAKTTRTTRTKKSSAKKTTRKTGKKS